MVSEKKKSILLTFDVEDWFQVENFKAVIKFSTWNQFELRVERNTFKILDFLDSFPFKPKATFFVLGWIAQKLPSLVREIHQRGHEVASHGFNHHLCQNLTGQDLIKDLKLSRQILEKIINNPVYGFRAPSFAVNNKILNSIQKAGYSYDSSFNSFSVHDRYGTIDLSHVEKKEGLYKIGGTFFELPISNYKVQNKVIPLGGGGYFRLLPFGFFKYGMKSILKKENAFVFYAHPWEFDPSQPRVKQASPGFKFRHYLNLHKTERKIKTLISSFKGHNFISCNDYINMTDNKYGTEYPNS